MIRIAQLPHQIKEKIFDNFDSTYFLKHPNVRREKSNINDSLKFQRLKTIIKASTLKQTSIIRTSERKSSVQQNFNVFGSFNSNFLGEEVYQFLRRKSCEGPLYGFAKKEKSIINSDKYEIPQHRKSRLKILLNNLGEKQPQLQSGSSVSQVDGQQKNIFIMKGHQEKSMKKSRKEKNLKTESLDSPAIMKKLESKKQYEISQIQSELEEFKKKQDDVYYFRKYTVNHYNVSSIDKIKSDVQFSNSIELLEPSLQLINQSGNTLESSSTKIVPNKYSGQKIISKPRSQRGIEVKGPLFPNNLSRLANYCSQAFLSEKKIPILEVSNQSQKLIRIKDELRNLQIFPKNKINQIVTPGGTLSRHNLNKYKKISPYSEKNNCFQEGNFKINQRIQTLPDVNFLIKRNTVKKILYN